MKENTSPPFHYWKVRLYTALFMICLSFLGLIITEIRQEGAWHYWRILCLLFAIISISLHVFLRRHEKVSYIGTIWHEILHWLGLLLAVCILSVMVDIGILGRFLSSIAVMILLALSTYLAGIYMDVTLLFVGIFLGLFSLGLSFVSAYLYPALIPVVLIGAAVLWFYLRKKHRQHQDTTKGTS